MIRLENVSLAYDGAVVLDRLSLHVPTGAHIALMGASGCGKSSVIDLIAGLKQPTAGRVSVDAERISYAFQEPRLLPWRTAAENVNAVLSDRKATLPEAEAWLMRVGLGDAAGKYPDELSGGMRQRVNLARALAYGGDILLLDEPFSGLDGERRDELLSLIKRYAAGKTLVLSTHDRTEAEALADSIYIFQEKAFIPE